MTAKKRSKLVERIYGILKKSDFLCRVYEFKPQFQRLRRYGKLDPTQYIVNHEKKLVYLKVCKVANSSIKVAMCEEQLGEINNYSQIHANVSGTEILDKKAKDYYKFSFVRNPYERLVSCYVNKFITDKKEFAAKGKTPYIENYLFGYIRNPKSFEDFINKICKIPTCLEDRHFQKQYNLMYDKRGKCIVDYVGKYENIQEDFEFLRTKFDLKPLPHYNVTKKGNWMDYYTLDTANKVYKKYKKDIQTFGYEDTYKELIAYLKSKKSK